MTTKKKAAKQQRGELIAEGRHLAESAIARRLAEKFQPTGNFHGAKSEVSAADVGWWLDVNEEDVEQLLDLGLMKTNGDDGYSPRHTTVFEVERFLAANPWWFKLRRQINAKAFAERLERVRTGGPSRRALLAMAGALKNVMAHAETTKAQPDEAAA